MQARSGNSSRMAEGVKANLKLTGISVAAILVLIVILQNTEPVVTQILWLDIPMPRALLLFITFGVGFGSGYLFHFRRIKKVRQEDAQEDAFPAAGLPTED